LIPLAPNVVITGHYAVVDRCCAIGGGEDVYAQRGRTLRESGPEQPVFQALSRMFS